MGDGRGVVTNAFSSVQMWKDTKYTVSAPGTPTPPLHFLNSVVVQSSEFVCALLSTLMQLVCVFSAIVWAGNVSFVPRHIKIGPGRLIKFNNLSHVTGMMLGLMGNWHGHRYVGRIDNNEHILTVISLKIWIDNNSADGWTPDCVWIKLIEILFMCIVHKQSMHNWKYVLSSHNFIWNGFLH